MSVPYDVVVVGAGPGGLMAALTARREGLRVLLVEQKTEIARVQRTCAEALITKPNCDGETVSIADGKIIFHINDFSIPYRGAWVEMKRMIRLSSDGHKLTIEREETPVAMILNKEILLENLLEQVEKSGCEIQTETMGIKAVNTGDGVTVTLQKKGVRDEVTSKIAIAADGVNSRITQNLGLNQERKLFDTPKIVSYVLAGVKPAIPDAFIMFQGKSFGGYFMPKAPREKGGPPLYELCGLSEELIKTFMAEGRLASWFKDARVVKKTSAVINFYIPLHTPAAGKIMIVGDAASFIEVYMQGAVMYGYRAAKAAARELREGNGIGEYVRYWQDSYEYHRVEKREQAFRTAIGITQLLDEEINCLFAALEPHPIKSYYDEFDAPEKIIAAISKQLPHIRKDRPELAGKIEAVFQSSVEEICERMSVKEK